MNIVVGRDCDTVYRSGGAQTRWAPADVAAIVVLTADLPSLHSAPALAAFLSTVVQIGSLLDSASCECGRMGSRILHGDGCPDAGPDRPLGHWALRSLTGALSREIPIASVTAVSNCQHYEGARHRQRPGRKHSGLGFRCGRFCRRRPRPGRSTRSVPVAFQFAVTIGELVRYQPWGKL